jgi:hypothetical protein
MSGDVICALLGYYAALSGSSVPTFRDNILAPYSRVKKSKFFLDFLTLEYGANRLSRNVSTELYSRVKKSKKNLDFLTLEYGANMLSRNVGTELQLNAA